MSDYRWIDVFPVTRASRADLGWTVAECSRCFETSFENAEPYTEDWTHEHAQVCHPKWGVAKGPCEECLRGSLTPGEWVVYDSRGEVYGCRQSFDEAIQLADHKARIFLRGELMV